MNNLLRIKISKFNIGDLVTHNIQGYRAVIIDIDPVFQASKRYNPLSEKYKFAKENLWYRLLIDDCCQETYVKESLLSKDACHIAVNNPKVAKHLMNINGKYRPMKKHH